MKAVGDILVLLLWLFVQTQGFSNNASYLSSGPGAIWTMVPFQFQTATCKYDADTLWAFDCDLVLSSPTIDTLAQSHHAETTTLSYGAHAGHIISIYMAPRAPPVGKNEFLAADMGSSFASAANAGSFNLSTGGSFCSLPSSELLHVNYTIRDTNDRKKLRAEL